jgi:RNA polymerase sigma-70 factor (ECF subfamily)
VGQAQNGDQAAYEQLVKRHQQRVSAVVGGILRRREDVEDVAQQVFIKAYFSLKRFDQRSAFSTWLYKITVNECWDYLRKKRVRPLVYEADLSEDQARQMGSFVTAGKAPADSSERAAMRQQVERLLDQLSEEDRQMMVLKEVEGFSVEEVGEILGLNVNTVKVRLFRARARLVKSLRRRKKENVFAKSARTSAGQGKD